MWYIDKTRSPLNHTSCGHTPFAIWYCFSALSIESWLCFSLLETLESHETNMRVLMSGFKGSCRFYINSLGNSHSTYCAEAQGSLRQGEQPCENDFSTSAKAPPTVGRLNAAFLNMPVKLTLAGKNRGRNIQITHSQNHEDL